MHAASRIKHGLVFTLALSIYCADKTWAEPAYQSDEIYGACRTELPVCIDGKMDEPAWRQALPLPVLRDRVNGTAPRYAITARILWDTNALYIGYTVGDPDVWAFQRVDDEPMCAQKMGFASGVTNAMKPGGWGTYIENYVMFYLDPDGDGKNYVEVNINPLNKVNDKWQELPWGPEEQLRLGVAPPRPANPHVDWNCPGMQTAVAVNGTLNDPYDVDQGWTVEVAVPFAALRQFAGDKTCPPRQGDCWRVMLAREYRPYPFYTREAVFWTWPELGGNTTHIPSRWGFVAFQDLSAAEQTSRTNMPKAHFDWKALWMKSPPSNDKTAKLVAWAAENGFQALIVPMDGHAGDIQSAFGQLIGAATQRHMQVFADLALLKSSPALIASHPECAQKIKERDNTLSGCVTPAQNLFCPDHGLADFQRERVTKLLQKHDIAGIALTDLRYANGYACYCDESIRRRSLFAGAHPEYTEKEVLRNFSETALQTWAEELRRTVQAVNTGMVVMVWMAPEFELIPGASNQMSVYVDLATDYGKRLPADCCARTMAPGQPPFWSYGKINALTRQYLALPDKPDAARFVPVLEVGHMGVKTAERLRQEIRLIGAAGAHQLIVAVETMDLDREVKLVVEEEFH